MRQRLKWRGIVLCALFGLLFLSNWPLVATVMNQPQLFFPADFDHSPPAFSRVGDQRHLLVFSKTNGYRHHDSIPAALHMLEQIAANSGWFVYATENAAVFNTQTLGEFDVVVLNNSSGSLWTPEQQLALRRFLQAGGGLVALNAKGPHIEALVNHAGASFDLEYSQTGAMPPWGSWLRIGAGKLVYSALGQRVETYREPDYIKRATEAIHWVTRAGS